jgi:thiamine-monophosphate kinase
MREFDLIHQYFNSFVDDPTVLVGIGDDAAVVTPHAGKNLVVATDTLISGTHYLFDTPAEAIAQKALAVNISDMAAMGAVPRWFTLVLSMTNSDETWLSAFSSGLKNAAQLYNIALIGGDTASGCDAVTIQIIGEVEPHKMLLRSGAKIGDLIVVSGDLGAACAGLAILCDQIKMPDKAAREYCCMRHQLPTPRLTLGQLLVDFATSAIDISDGLLADLGHILEQSQVGATLYSEKIPVTEAIKKGHWHEDERLTMALTGGDDYELCFTIPADRAAELDQLSIRCNVPLTVIGEIKAEPGLQVLNHEGETLVFEQLGWQHFA